MKGTVLLSNTHSSVRDTMVIIPYIDTTFVLPYKR